MFYSVNLLRTTAQETASQIALRNCSQEVREELGYIGIFAVKQTNCGSTSKDYCWLQKQTSGVNDFSSLHVWEDKPSRAHWNCSLDMHLNLGLVSCTFPSWIPLRGIAQVWCQGGCTDLAVVTFAFYWNGRRCSFSTVATLYQLI